MATLGEQVGAIVRHQRKQRGWSQDELAERAGRSVEMITRVERGRTAPSLDTLERLASALGVPVRDMFQIGDHAVQAGRDDALVRLIGRVSGLGSDDLTWVDDLVRVALARKVRSPVSRN